MNRLLVICIGLALLVGCGPKVEMLAEPVSISGKLTGGGTPIGNVVLTLQPIEIGHPVLLQVGGDGSFAGKAIPGKYVYFVTEKEDDPGAIEKVAAKFRDADMARTVVVVADQPTVDIALD